MKTYILTEKDLEDLKHNLMTEDYVISSWVEKLKELPISEKQGFNCTIPDDFYINRAKYFVNVILDTDKDEFEKFLNDNGFAKPQQPYYVANGKIFSYKEVRDKFTVKNKNR